MIVFVVLAVILGLLWYDLNYGMKNNAVVRKLPGPKTIPWIGNGYDFLGSASDFLYNLDDYCRKYGNRVRIIFANKVLVLLCDPKDIEAILSSNDLLDKAEEYRYLHEWLGEGLLNSTGDKWRRHRKFLTPAFHFSILRHFVPIFDERTNSFVKKLASFADGKPVDIYPLAARCTLNQLSESAMGTSTEDDSEANLEYVESVKLLTELINERIRNVFMRIDWMFRLSSSYKIYKRALNFVKEYTDKLIRERANLLNEKGVDLAYYTKQDDDIGSRKCVAFLDLLLLSELEGRRMEYEEIKNEVDTFLFEGHDTTASGLSFTMYLIANHPDVQQRLYEEQMQINGGEFNKEITIRDVHEMKYLDIVLKESMRIYPPVPFIARYTKKEFQMNDLVMPAGVSLGISIYTLNRDPKFFPDPLTFNPERFVGDESNRRNPFSYIIFSAGPRNCIGQKFAMYEMKVTLAKVIRNYQLLPANKPDMILTGDVTLKSANGIYIKLKKREKSE